MLTNILVWVGFVLLTTCIITTVVYVTDRNQRSSQWVISMFLACSISTAYVHLSCADVSVPLLGMLTVGFDLQGVISLPFCYLLCVISLPQPALYASFSINVCFLLSSTYGHACC